MVGRELFYFLYGSIYLISAFFVLMLITYKVISGRRLQTVSEARLAGGSAIALSLLLILIVGFRGFDVGVDTANYYSTWLYSPNLWSFKTDFLFYYLMAAVKAIFESYQVFLLLVALLYYMASYISLAKFSKYFNANIFYVLFVFVSLFFSLSSSTNVVRQGLSLAFLLLALAFSMERKPVYVYFFLIISVALHMTAVIPVVMMLVVKTFKRVGVNLYVGLFFLGVLLSFFNFGVLSIAPFMEGLLMEVGDKRVHYLSSHDYGYRTGFRLDFVVFNSVFLMIFMLVRRKLNDDFYDSLLKLYCLCSFIFFMSFQISFSDRFGLFGWFLIAPLLAPVLGRCFSTLSGLLVLLLSFSLYSYFFYIA